MGISSTPLRAGSSIAAMVSEEPQLRLSDSSSSGKGLRVGTSGAGMIRMAMLRDEDLPPSPAKPEIDRRMPWEKLPMVDGERRSVKDAKVLRREMMGALEGVCEK